MILYAKGAGVARLTSVVVGTYYIVSRSQTAFFRLHLGWGKKGSGQVSIGYSFLTPPTAMGSVNEFQHLSPTTWY